METEIDNSVFKTDDLLVASFLLCRNAHLFDISSNDTRHFEFIFNDPNECQVLVREYLNNAMAPARELFARREELVSAMRYRNRYGGPNGTRR